MGMMFRLNMITIISMPLISIGLLASLSKNYGKDEPWLKMAFIAGILGEIISIAALTVLDAASTSGFGTELFIKVGYLLVFMVAVYLIYRLLHLLFWWYPELKKDSRTQNRHLRSRYTPCNGPLLHSYCSDVLFGVRVGARCLYRRYCHLCLLSPRKTA